MPQIRKHPDWGKRYLWKNFLTGVPFLIGFAVVWWRFSQGFQVDVTGFLMIGMLIYGFIAWQYQQRREHRCICPECGQQIVGRMGGYDLVPGDPLRFHCQKCDIVWDTGATQGDSS